mgnify:FL=1
MNQEWTVGLSLTEKCNETCKHCYIGRKNLWKQFNYETLDLTKEQISALIPQFKEIGVTRVNFGGGEAPLHLDFLSVVQDLFDAGIKISLTTNGSTFPKIR